MGVEPTIHPAKGRIAGFEDREDHRTPCASVLSIQGLSERIQSPDGSGATVVLFIFAIRATASCKLSVSRLRPAVTEPVESRRVRLVYCIGRDVQG